MGAGASTSQLPEEFVDLCKSEVGVTADRGWKDADDINDLVAAKAEISRLRGLAIKACAKQQPSTKKHRAGVAVEHAADATGPYVRVDFPKSDEVRKLIEGICKENILFKHCKGDEYGDLVAAFEPIEPAGGAKVVSQGEKGDLFYVIESGTLDVELKHPGAAEAVKVAALGAGLSFGELALMYGTPRAATVKASGPCKLWCINRTTYRRILTHFHAQRSQRNIDFLKVVEIAEGDKQAKLEDCLSRMELEHLADALEDEKFEDGDVIIRQGEAGDYFYLIASGEVTVCVDPDSPPYKDGNGHLDTSDKKKVASLAVGKFFGQKALLSEDVRNASCKACGTVHCLTLGREDFTSMLGSVHDLLEGQTKPKDESEDVMASREDEQMAVEEFTFVSILGQGAFGKVRLAYREQGARKDYFAVKCLQKAAIVENVLQEHVMTERQILMALDHPFIVRLYSSMQDKKYVYFVLELLLGGEMFSWLRKETKLEETAARFYAAQVVLAFQHMHLKSIAYRDTKPENLVLDDKGYLKVLDLGLAKIVETKTWTLCGTPDYLAPEIILNEGHDKAVDYWALGVLIFELVAGQPPFYSDDPMEVYEKILSSNMNFPATFSKNLCELVRKMLKMCQSKRLGNGKGGCNGIIKSKWFTGFDWEGCLGGGLVAPFEITLKSKDDLEYFDKYDEDDGQVEDCDDWEPSFA